MTVKDQVGIPAEQLERIFDMFTQVDATLERARGGLGIGLTLVKRLVEMHGGTVTAHSEGADEAVSSWFVCPSWRRCPREVTPRPGPPIESRRPG